MITNKTQTHRIVLGCGQTAAYFTTH